MNRFLFILLFYCPRAVKKVKVKCTLVQALGLCTAVRPIGGVEVQLYSFLTSALGGVRCQCHASAAFYPRERPGTHYTGGWVGRCGKLPPKRFDPHTVQPVASHYTDYATRPTPEQYVQENVEFLPVSFPVTYIECEMNASLVLRL